MALEDRGDSPRFARGERSRGVFVDSYVAVERGSFWLCGGGAAGV
jgi:hypothetical protein